MLIFGYVVTLLCVTLNNTALSLFCCGLMRAKYPRTHVLIFTVMVPAILLPLDLAGIAEIGIGNSVRTLCSVVIMTSATILLFEGRLTKKLFVLAFGMIIESCVQSLVALPMVLNGFVRYEGNHMELNMDFTLMQVTTFLSNAAVLFLIATVIRKGPFLIRFGTVRPLALFLITQALLFNQFVMKAYGDHSFGTFLEWILLIFCCILADIAAFYILREMDKKAELEARASRGRAGTSADCILLQAPYRKRLDFYETQGDEAIRHLLGLPHSSGKRLFCGKQRPLPDSVQSAGQRHRGLS